MDPATREQLKKKLEEEAARLEAELRAFAKPDPRMPGDWDTSFPRPEATRPPASHSAQDEQADEREEYEVELAQEYALESRLAEVRRALQRMAEGTYGRCLACGEEIPEERLSANPAAEYDIGHQPREGRR